MTTGVPTLVDPDWLEARLDEPDLRVLDCTVDLSFDDETGERHQEACREAWAESHVPGSAYADLVNDLSVTDDPDFPFQLPDADAFAAEMEALGVGDDTRVVLYDDAGNNWAARVWWMLRAMGFDDAGVLDGGWERWTAEGRPTSAEPPEPREVTFTPAPRSDLVADKAEVRASVDEEATCLVNALRPSDHAGEGTVKYGRPGHIPGSVNVPAVGEESIYDEETGEFRAVGELRRRFEAAGVTDADRVVTYCGGGIAASGLALALHLVGVENAAVYDGSLSEWGPDTDLPMTTE